jgi:hypothetical protein
LGVSLNNQFVLPMTKGLIAIAAVLLSMGK